MVIKIRCSIHRHGYYYLLFNLINYELCQIIISVLDFFDFVAVFLCYRHLGIPKLYIYV